MSPEPPHRRGEFVVVANRPPVAPGAHPGGGGAAGAPPPRLPAAGVAARGGGTAWRRSPGGLVTAIAPVLQRREGVWLGWPGAPDERLEPFTQDGMSLLPIPLSSSEVELYYEGFSNATLWPLYHDVVARPVYDRTYWES